MSVFDSAIKRVLSLKYLTTAVELSNGNIIEARGSIRQALLSAGDSWAEVLYNDIPSVGTEVFLSLPLKGSRSVGFYISNTLDVPVTIKIYLYGGIGASLVYLEVIPAGQIRVIAPGVGGLGAGVRYISVPALAFPVFGTISISYWCASGIPTTGILEIDAGRLS